MYMKVSQDDFLRELLNACLLEQSYLAWRQVIMKSDFYIRICFGERQKAFIVRDIYFFFLKCSWNTCTIMYVLKITSVTYNWSYESYCTERRVRLFIYIVIV
jgi:hypothetical protein